MSIMDRVQSGTGDEGWTIHTDGSLRYIGQVVVPQLTDLREEILREFHFSRFAVHPGGTKMYQDLRRQYYSLPGYPRSTITHTASCLYGFHGKWVTKSIDTCSHFHSATSNG